MDPHEAREIAFRKHYMHRKPSVSFAFGLRRSWWGPPQGICTFGWPASRFVQVSICPTAPEMVIELNRLWVDDQEPKNSESWFIAKCLKLLPPRIVVSYADTAQGHAGVIYQAANFNYAGLTKERTDAYAGGNKHSRHYVDAAIRVDRSAKHRYWIVTGNRREKRDLKRLVAW